MGDAFRFSASPFSRRAFLVACAPVAACARPRSDSSGPAPVALPIERFPTGVRVTVSVSGHPVEVLRSTSGVTARSLLCTHQGCEVAWSDADGVYSCPCHEGKFDADGRPKEGPPPKPLPTLPARIEGSLLLVGPQAPMTLPATPVYANTASPSAHLRVNATSPPIQSLGG